MGIRLQRQKSFNVLGNKHNNLIVVEQAKHKKLPYQNVCIALIKIFECQPTMNSSYKHFVIKSLFFNKIIYGEKGSKLLLNYWEKYACLWHELYNRSRY